MATVQISVVAEENKWADPIFLAVDLNDAEHKVFSKASIVIIYHETL